jgi:hypothetical protein
VSPDELRLILTLAPRRYPEYEEEIFKSEALATDYMIALGYRINNDLPFLLYYYAAGILQERWPVAEHIIMQHPQYAYHYAREVIRGRWHAAEPIIANDAQAAYYYAKDVIHGVWPEAEQTIVNHSIYSYMYSMIIEDSSYPNYRLVFRTKVKPRYRAVIDWIKRKLRIK